MAAQQCLSASTTATFYSTKSRDAFVDKTGKTAVLHSMASLAARLVLLSKTISWTIEAIFLGSKVPEGNTKNKQVANTFYYTKSRKTVVGKTGKTTVLPSMALLAARLVLLSKTISSTIEAIFLGSQVPEGYTKNKQALCLSAAATATFCM